MTIDEIFSRWRERPFRPFRIHTDDNRRFEVVHPDAMGLSRNWVNVATYAAGDRPGEHMPDDLISFSPMHVLAIEDLWKPTA